MTCKNVRLQRKKRIRAKVRGSAERPRLTVFKSNRHLYLQVIDDDEGKVILAVNSLQKSEMAVSRNLTGMEILAHKLANDLLELNVKNLVFDRNGYPYFGLLKRCVEILREKGMVI